MNITYMYIHPFCPLFFPHSHQDRYVSGIRRFIPYPSQWTNSLHYLFPIIIFAHKRIHGTCVCMYQSKYSYVPGKVYKVIVFT